MLVRALRATLVQARPGASPEVSVPLQRSLAVPRCPVLPASGRSRCGVPARRATAPAGADASFVEAAVRSGPVAGRSPRPCGFPPAPAETANVSPAVTVRAPARSGHAPPLLTADVPLPARAVARPGRCPPRIRGTGGAPGVRPFAALSPPAGVAASPPLGPTCRFPDALSRRLRSMLRQVVRPPCTHVAPGLIRIVRRRPRLLGFVPAGDARDIVVRRALRRDSATRNHPLPPWTFPLSGLRPPALGPRPRADRFVRPLARPRPLLGFPPCAAVYRWRVAPSPEGHRSVVRHTRVPSSDSGPGA